MSGARSLDGFDVAVSFADDQAILAVNGELDRITAPELRAILDGVIDCGHRDIVLDLAGLAFMGAAGLGIIASTLGRLESRRGSLTFRSTPSAVERIVKGVDLATGIHWEDPVVDHHLGAEQSAALPGIPVVEPDDLALHLGRPVAGTDVVDGVLRLVVALAVATVSGADGVRISLVRHGRLITVAASNETITDMDAGQYATGEGPCVDAAVEGRWFHAEMLASETRWPKFTPKARQLGINAILSTPLLSRDHPVGALNMYSRTAGAFAAEAQQLASMLATHASLVLADAGVAVTDTQAGDRLSVALRARHVIAMAQGAVMERHGLSEEAATLRGFSQATSVPLVERAASVVASTRRPGPVAPPTGEPTSGGHG